jgi:hypothetical protein
MAHTIELPDTIVWDQPEHSDSVGKVLDSYDWVARGARSIAFVKTAPAPNLKGPIVKVSIQEFPRVPLKPWVYFEWPHTFAIPKNYGHADYRRDKCWCIDRTGYAYPSCFREMVIGSYQAQVAVYALDDRCLKSKDGYDLPLKQYESFARLVNKSEFVAVRALSSPANREDQSRRATPL